MPNSTLIWLLCCDSNSSCIYLLYRIVRLTSPTMNYFILVGVALIYCTIFVYFIRTTDRQVYKIRCYVCVTILSPM